MKTWTHRALVLSITGLAAMTVTLLLSACDAAPSPETTGSQSEAESVGKVHPEVWPDLKSPVGLDDDIENRVSGFLAAMSDEEKVGQIIQGEIRHTTPEDVRQYHLGSVLNGGGSFPNNEKQSKPSDWLALADAYWEASTDTSDGGQGIPLIWGVDAVHGHNNVIGATLFPHNIGLGAARDADLMRRIGEATGAEVLATGLDWNFGPTLAVVRDDRWGRTYEGYSEHPEIVAELGAALVEGLQGAVGSDEFLSKTKIIATAKHYLGDGGTHTGKDQGDNRSTEAELRDIHGAGYFTTLQSGVQTVMASFSSWHGQKMHGHHELLTDVLKGRMGFDGFVVGDWNGHGQLPDCTNGNCAAAFLAGVDMFMVPEDWKELYGNLLAQVKSGEIPGERLDDAVRRILRVKLRAGLLDRGKPSDRPVSADLGVIGSAKHREVAREAVRKSLVLLKNNDSVLPIDPSLRILVAGSGADNIGQQSGGWTISWQGTGNEKSDFPGGSSIWDGIQQAAQAAGGKATLSADGSYDQKPDVAIVVYGEEPYAEFQGDRDSVAYEGPGLELLKKLKADGIPTVSIFLSGRPLWMNPQLNASDAFVAAWLPGSEGVGIADVIFKSKDGSLAYDFQGKLSFSWPADPSHAVLNVGSETKKPLFPFGFGGSYAEPTTLAELSEEIEEIEVGDSAKVYFEGGAVPPWKLFLGDETDWRVPAPGALATTRTSQRLKLRVSDRRVQEDSRSVRWHFPGTEAVVYLHSEKPVDLEREANGGLALSFDVFMEEAPSDSVTLAMGCGGEQCRAELDLTDALSELPLETWQTLRFSLRCFAEAGMNMNNVEIPFSVGTEGTLAMRFSDVKLVTAAEGNALCPKG